MKARNIPIVRTKAAADAWFDAQDRSTILEFRKIRNQKVNRYKRIESLCNYHGWRKADREGANKMRRKLQQEANKRTGRRVKIPHPAGEDRKKPRVWV
jgi:hypothetical protein